MTTQAPFSLRGRNPDVLTCIARRAQTCLRLRPRSPARPCMDRRQAIPALWPDR